MVWTGLTTNVAEQEWRFDRPPAEVLAALKGAVEALPRWTLVELDESALTLKAIHRTRIFGFVDDVSLVLIPDGEGAVEDAEGHGEGGGGGEGGGEGEEGDKGESRDLGGGCTVRVRSASRVGKGDLGQNRRNLEGLRGAVVFPQIE